MVAKQRRGSAAKLVVLWSLTNFVYSRFATNPALSPNSKGSLFMLLNPLTRFTALVCLFATAIFMTKTYEYPPARKSDQVDVYHGIRVADPYRWLEDLDSEETRQWVEAENKLTFSYLNAIPERTTIRERLTKLWDFEKYGVPFKEGDRYFYTRNSGLQNQSVLYTVNTLDGEPQQVIDPNILS